jgi:hypothetical protein
MRCKQEGRATNWHAPSICMTDLIDHVGQRNLEPAWRAPDGVAAIPTAALDPPRSAASPMVPALHGSGSPTKIITTTILEFVSGIGQVLSGLFVRHWSLQPTEAGQPPACCLCGYLAAVPLAVSFAHGRGGRLLRRPVAQFYSGVDKSSLPQVIQFVSEALMPDTLHSAAPARPRLSERSPRRARPWRGRSDAARGPRCPRSGSFPSSRRN